MLASSGLTTPPTMLQNAPCGAWFKRALVHSEHDIPLSFLYLHALHQCADNITSAGPVHFIQSAFNSRGEVFQPANDQLQLIVQGCFISEFFRLLLKLRHPLSQPCDPRLELPLLDDAFRVRLNEPDHTLSQLTQLRFDPS